MSKQYSLKGSKKRQQIILTKPTKPPLTKRQASTVRKIANQTLNKRTEVKYHNQSNTGSSPDYTGNLAVINDMGQGSTDVQRNGDEIRMRSLQMQYSIVPGDSTNLVRVVLFQWYGESTPAASDLLSSTASTLAPISPYLHDLMYQKPKRFHILFDKTHVVDSVASPLVVGKLRITKFDRRRVHYASAASTPNQNRLCLLFISDSGAAAHPSVGYFARLNYDDV